MRDRNTCLVASGDSDLPNHPSVVARSESMEEEAVEVPGLPPLPDASSSWKFPVGNGGSGDVPIASLEDIRGGEENLEWILPLDPRDKIGDSLLSVLDPLAAGEEEEEVRRLDPEREARRGEPVAEPSSSSEELSSMDPGRKAAAKASTTSGSKGQKRTRQQRFAFMTRSEIDHLEDGYRWRKYGQKAVKNSPFPRGYFRCTNSKCSVKKRVERSAQDPGIVITTYEGQHCHHTVSFPRGNAHLLDAISAQHLRRPLLPPPQLHLATVHNILSYPPNPTTLVPGHSQKHDELQESTTASELESTPASSFSTADGGLLDDIVPPAMRGG